MKDWKISGEFLYDCMMADKLHSIFHELFAQLQIMDYSCNFTDNLLDWRYMCELINKLTLSQNWGLPLCSKKKYEFLFEGVQFLKTCCLRSSFMEIPDVIWWNDVNLFMSVCCLQGQHVLADIKFQIFKFLNF